MIIQRVSIPCHMLTHPTLAPPPKALNQHWEDLLQLTEKKKKQLEGEHQVQKFIR